jgi:hypothetical protein
MSSIHSSGLFNTLEINMLDMAQNNCSASLKYCNTAIFPLIKINSSSVKYPQKLFLIVSSSIVKAYFAPILFVLSNSRYQFFANLINVVIAQSNSIFVLLLFNLPKNL